MIEVRGADAVPPGLTCSLPALWKGLLYDAGARRPPRSSSPAARTKSAKRRAATWLAAGSPRATPAGRCSSWRASSRRSAARDCGASPTRAARDPDESSYLDPVFAQLELGASPGQVVLDRWEGEWGRSLDRLIEYARY